MAINLMSQPAADSINAAYKPIQFLLEVNQLPTGPATPAPVVYADLYFDGVYYSSISVTDYEVLAIWIFVFNLYTFDIQDKVQEYLKSRFERMYESTDGDIDNFDAYSCSVRVEFRESYVDGNGFVQTYGTTPVQGTKYTAPVSGAGTVASNTFYVLNATLRHEDAPDLSTHLAGYKEPFQTTHALSHRPNNIPSAGFRVGEGKYYVCAEDNDFIFAFMEPTTPLPPNWLVGVYVTYRNGTTANQINISFPTLTATAASKKVYSFNAGIPHLRTITSTINWSEVAEYEVIVYNVFFQAMRQRYVVKRGGCCDERVRIFFLNNLGTYDAINFEAKREVNKTAAESWQRGRSYWDGTTKALYSGVRMQVQQNDFYTVQCNDYGEKDMEWIKELLGSPRTYLQWKGVQGQADSLVPIVIEDSEVETLKVNERFEYVITLKYRMSNEKINLR